MRAVPSRAFTGNPQYPGAGRALRHPHLQVGRKDKTSNRSAYFYKINKIFTFLSTQRTGAGRNHLFPRFPNFLSPQYLRERPKVKSFLTNSRQKEMNAFLQAACFSLTKPFGPAARNNAVLAAGEGN
ncbi:hypothetical protein [Puniceibacterium sediminis]|uniref:hypothetical protein n=1 Tax=Puniceibacterium sediminis TaxID=1608407 RepID=UPI0011309891|nr:hypothetical protein [Puniceibacterium sediminis]